MIVMDEWFDTELQGDILSISRGAGELLPTHVSYRDQCPDKDIEHLSQRQILTVCAEIPDCVAGLGHSHR